MHAPQGGVLASPPWHSPVRLPVPSPLSPPSLLGSLCVRLLPSFLQVQTFLGGLGGRGGPCLLVCLEVPLENISNTYCIHQWRKERESMKEWEVQRTWLFCARLARVKSLCTSLGIGEAPQPIPVRYSWLLWGQQCGAQASAGFAPTLPHSFPHKAHT